MAKTTAISWVADPTTGNAGRTWNPVTGCDKIADGCERCYALRTAARLKSMGAKRYQNDGHPETSGPGFGVTMHRDLLETPKSWRAPTMVFVNSMSDLFHARVDLGFVADVFDTMRETPRHTYQVLTKRASRLPKIVDKIDWPANLWMGVSVENEAAMDRVEALKCVPTSVRFLSAEPLLEPLPGLDLDGIDWVIVGGESGPDHRPFDAAWASDIRSQCAQSPNPGGTAFFFKQHGGKTSKAGGNLLDGEVVQAFPTPDPTRLR